MQVFKGGGDHWREMVNICGAACG